LEVVEEEMEVSDIPEICQKFTKEMSFEANLQAINGINKVV